MAGQKSVLVVSAHAADFVWRAGGVIALYTSRGYRVRILCLSFGERGESQGAWKKPGMTIEKVKEIRREESTRAASILGAEIRFFDSGDYPIVVTQETVDAMVNEFRELQPEFVLTHSFADPYNPDHPTANNVTLQTRVALHASFWKRLLERLAQLPIDAPFLQHHRQSCRCQLLKSSPLLNLWDEKSQKQIAPC